MSQSNKYFSDKQEKLVANTLGWKQVSGSGARPFHYGDVISDEWLAECKTHTEPNQPIFFSKEVWEKIQAEAVIHQRKPVLIVDNGSQTYENTWCLIHNHNVDWSVYSLYDTKIIDTSNLTFKNEELQNLYSSLDYHYLYKFKWNNKLVVIVPFGRFKDMVTDF